MESGLFFSPEGGEDIFKTVFTRAAAAMAIASVQGNLLAVNAAFCRLLGYSEKELLARSVRDITHPEDRAATIRTFQEIVGGKRTTFHYRKRYLRKDGSAVWGHSTVSRVPAASGSHDYCVALIRDPAGIETAGEALRQRVFPSVCAESDEDHIVVMWDKVKPPSRMEEALCLSEERFRRLAEAAPMGVFETDSEGRTIFCNARWREFTGQNPELAAGLGWSEVIHPGDVQETRKLWADAVAARRDWAHEYRTVRPDGSIRWLRALAAPIRGEGETPLGYVGMVDDITRKKETLDALRKSEARYRSIFENAGAGMFTITPEGRILTVNPALCQFLGYAEDELKRLSAKDIMSADDRLSLRDLLAEAKKGAQRQSFEKMFFRKDEATAWGDVTLVWIQDEAGRVDYGIGMVQDITRRKKAEQDLLANQKHLNFLAHHDPLTGLPNRLLFQDRLEHALAKARRFGKVVALLFIDLDRFKNLNDSFGHDFGDQILSKVAKILQGVVREADTLARLGGDEFVIIIEQFTDPQAPTLVADKILDLLAQPLVMEGVSFHVSASIGIAIYPADAADPSELMKCADSAMYQAKERGRNAFHYYTQGRTAQTRKLFLLENSLREGLEKEQLVLNYQPIVELSSGRVIGVEVLLRWHHPDLGMVRPGDFIPLAEETGLIVPIGEWVLFNACRQIREWMAQGLPPLRLSVNISGRQFRQGNLVERVARTLEAARLDAAHLELELTESMVMNNVEQAIATMKGLASMGVSLAIDDFGTGYSSLNHLKRFPIRTLKIDQSFIHDITENPNDATIATSIISLARALNLEVVAEGIEKSEQLDFLLRGNCVYGQGFFFARPMPAEEFRRYLEQNRQK